MNIENLSKKERLRMLNSIYVAHPDATQILQKMKRCHESREYSNEPRSMSLTGETGTGKTTLIEQYMLKHPPSETEKTSSVPIFKSLIQPDTSIRDFIGSVLKSLIASVSGIREDDVDDELLKGSLPMVRKRLYSYIAEAEVKLIILDEFQHLISKHKKKVLSDVADTIKTLINETKVPIILVGTTKAKAVFAENPEMSRRIAEKIQLKPFSISTDDEINTFRRFLANVDKLLPFEKRSNLAEKEMTLRLYATSNGYIDDIMRIILEAGYNAIIGDEENINKELLAQAFENTPGENQTAEGNPFTASIEKLQHWGCIESAILGETHTHARKKLSSATINDFL